MPFQIQFPSYSSEMRLALLQVINKHQDSVNSGFSKAFILESIEFILKNNSFKFNDEYFLQLVGTATRAEMASTYATITMGYYEVKFYAECELN